MDFDDKQVGNRRVGGVEGVSLGTKFELSFEKDPPNCIHVTP